MQAVASGKVARASLTDEDKHSIALVLDQSKTDFTLGPPYDPKQARVLHALYTQPTKQKVMGRVRHQTHAPEAKCIAQHKPMK